MLAQKFYSRYRKGVAFLLALIFVALFATFAVSLAAISGTNVQIANNQTQANRALTNAYSGLEVLRYYFNPKASYPLIILGSEEPLLKIKDFLNSSYPESKGLTAEIIDSKIKVDKQFKENPPEGFYVLIQYADSNQDRIKTEIVGYYGTVTKKIQVNFDIDPLLMAEGFFGYGVATRGPLVMSGQASIDDVNIVVKSDVYIDAKDIGVSTDAFSSAAQTSISGDVKIANPNAKVSVFGSVGGVLGGEGHVHKGVPRVEFPEANPQHFLQYATGPQISSSKIDKTTTSLNNAIIKAGSNITFSKDLTINGVLYIETPSSVHFSGKATINGIIVGDGIDNGSDGSSSIKFSGQVISSDVSTLVGSEFNAIKKETGSLIVAPGFTLEFVGQNNNMGGAIAGNGIKFSGQASGTIKNSVINYSKVAMTMSGQGSLRFDRNEPDKPPAGFDYKPERKLKYNPDSYSEPEPIL